MPSRSLSPSEDSFKGRPLRTQSEAKKDQGEDDDIIEDRRGTFRPPFDPNGAKYTKQRGDAENFTFNNRDSDRRRQLKSAENPFKGLLPNLKHQTSAPDYFDEQEELLIATEAQVESSLNNSGKNPPSLSPSNYRSGR